MTPIMMLENGEHYVLPRTCHNNVSVCIILAIHRLRALCVDPFSHSPVVVKLSVLDLLTRTSNLLLDSLAVLLEVFTV